MTMRYLVQRYAYFTSHWVTKREASTARAASDLAAILSHGYYDRYRVVDARTDSTIVEYSDGREV